MMSDADADDDDDFWKELESDITNGLNNESDYCEEDFHESDCDLEEAPSFPSMKSKKSNKTKPKKCDDSTSHYHCYCLRSTVFKHRFKNYVGFTTNPERRLKQHNGIVKHGGAWKTKRGGRPWEFVVLVAGFPTHTMALQFEWAWQHPGKSLLVRAAIGDGAAKTLQRKRGTPGQMCILKTLLELCPDLYDRNQITLNFLQQDCREIYDKVVSMPALPEAVIAANLISIKQVAKKRKLLSNASDALGLPPPPVRRKAPAVSVRVISSLDEMPFWATRNKKAPKQKQRAQTDDPSSQPQQIENTILSSSADAKRSATSNRDGIADIYRRCREFNLLCDSTSSEDELDEAPGHATMDENDESDIEISDRDDHTCDDAIVVHTTRKKGVGMEILSIDSSSSSEDSAVDDFRYKYNTKHAAKKNCQPERLTLGKYNSTSVTKSNVISIDDDSSDDSFENYVSLRHQSFRKENALATETARLSFEEKVDALVDVDVRHSLFGGEHNTTNKVVPTLSLEETLDALTVIDEPRTSSKCDNGNTFDSSGSRWVTTRKMRRQKQSANTSFLTSMDKENNFSFDDVEICIEENKRDKDFPSCDNDSPVSASVMSPSIARPKKTKRMTIVDLCTP